MKTLTDEMAAVMRELLPAVINESKDLSREAVQTVVWLVGLASALITLLAAHAGVVAALTITQRRILIPLLAATILCGVLQRIVNQLVEQRERKLFFGLQGHLAAYGTALEEPDQLNGQWTQDEIILRLKRDFDTDLTPLAEIALPIDFYRKLYSDNVDLWQQHQSKRLNDLLQVLAAYGMYDPANAMLSPADSLKAVRQQVSSITRLRRAGLWLFIGTCGSFLLALLLLAYAIFP